MYYLTKSEYNEILSKITTFPYTFPPLSMKEELDNFPAYYLGWAIWCSFGLPAPQNEFEKKSLKMVLEYIEKNLTLVDDSEADRLELVKW